MHEKNLDIDFRGEPGKFTTGPRKKTAQSGENSGLRLFLEKPDGHIKKSKSYEDVFRCKITQLVHIDI